MNNSYHDLNLIKIIDPNTRAKLGLVKEYCVQGDDAGFPCMNSSKVILKEMKDIRESRFNPLSQIPVILSKKASKTSSKVIQAATFNNDESIFDEIKVSTNSPTVNTSIPRAKKSISTLWKKNLELKPPQPLLDFTADANQPVFDQPIPQSLDFELDDDFHLEIIPSLLLMGF